MDVVRRAEPSAARLARGGSPAGGVRRGRREVGRRVPRHRGPAEGVRREPRLRHADQRGGDRRHGRRAGLRGLAFGDRVPVRCVQLSRVGTDHRSRREDARTGPRARGHADHHPHPLVRRHPREGASRREPRDLLRAHRRPQGRRSVLSAGWIHVDAPRHRRPRSRGDPGAQGSLLVEGDRRARRGRPGDRRGARGTRWRQRHYRHAMAPWWRRASRPPRH